MSNGDLQAAQKRILELEAQIAQLQGQVQAQDERLESLTLQAERYHVAFELNPVSVTITRLDNHQVVDVNEGFLSLTGYRRDQLIGKTAGDINLWCFEEERQQAYRELAQTGELKVQLRQFNLANGQKKTALISGKVIQFQGEPHLLLVAKDVQELYDTQLELNRQQERIRTLLDAPTSLIMLLDPEGAILQANQAASSYFKRPLDKLLNQNLWDLLEPQQLQVFRSRYEILVAQAKTNSETDQVGERWFHSIFYPNLDEQGRVKEAAVVVRDVTTSKQAELELAEQEVKYRALFEAAEDGFILFDVVCDEAGLPSDFAFVEANRAVTEITSYSGQAFAQTPLSALVTQGNRDWFEQLIEVATTGQSARFEVDARRINKSLEIFAFIPQQGRLACLVRDITERKATLAELSRAKSAAESAVMAKSRFLATMSHEIRTPLNGVLGMTSLLSQTELSSEQNEFVNIIGQCGENLLTVINDILDFTRLESSRIQFESSPLNLKVVIEETFSLCVSKAAAKRLELLYHVHPQVPETVMGDPVRIRQILINLVGNAIKFSDEGEVIVGVKLERHKGQRLTLQFSIKDQGIGIDPSTQESLFEPFKQLDSSTTRRYGGTGLGLAINRQLVELMGGKIWVESSPNQGSTFYFTIESTLSSRQLERPKASASLQGRPIYLFDSDPVHRSHLASLLRQEGLNPEMFSLDGAIKQLADLKDNGLLLINLPKEIHQHHQELNAFCVALKARKLPMVKLGFLNRDPIEEACPGGLLVNKPVRLEALFLNMDRALGMLSSRKLENVLTLDAGLGQRHPLRILIAEDNELNQALVLKLLEKMGFAADLATDGLQALKMIDAQQYDLLLLDIQMPEMDGLEVTRNLVGRQVRPWIVAMTANAMKGDRERYLDAGMDDYLAKPIDPFGLQDLLARYGRRI
ncbi:MAG: ATP-binding protein [bacterium]|nr:ATP-binding protein [bacterium]